MFYGFFVKESVNVNILFDYSDKFHTWHVTNSIGVAFMQSWSGKPQILGVWATDFCPNVT